MKKNLNWYLQADFVRFWLCAMPETLGQNSVQHYLTRADETSERECMSKREESWC